MAPQPFMVDPLEGLEQRPIETQVAVIANELRNQRNTLSEVKNTSTWILRTLVALLVSTIGGLALLFASVPHP